MSSLLWGNLWNLDSKLILSLRCSLRYLSQQWEPKLVGPREIVIAIAIFTKWLPQLWNYCRKWIWKCEKWVRESLGCHNHCLMCNSDVNSRMTIGMSAAWCVLMRVKREARTPLGIRRVAICVIWHTFCTYTKIRRLNL